MGGKKPLRRPLWPPTRATASNYYPLGLDGAGGAAKPLLRAPKKPAPLHGRLPAFSGAVDAFERARKCFLEWRYFFSIILSEFLKNRVALQLDRLIELVSQRIRDYIGAYYHLEELELPPPKDDHREALLQEQKTLSAQLEKRSMALKNLYLDKVSGVLSEGQFVELNQDFLEEKSRLERRLAQIDQELSGQEQPRNQEEVMAKARELLELKTLPRELAVMLIEKIEIGEQDQETGRQEVKIHWKF